MSLKFEGRCTPRKVCEELLYTAEGVSANRRVRKGILVRESKGRMIVTYSMGPDSALKYFKHCPFCGEKYEEKT